MLTQCFKKKKKSRDQFRYMTKKMTKLPFPTNRLQKYSKKDLGKK